MNQVTRISIIDDDRGMQESLRHLFRTNGIEVTVFPTVAKFDGSLEDGHSPDCLVVNLDLDDTDALALRERLRQDGHTFPIVVICGITDVPGIIEDIRNGTLHFVSRPFLHDGLIERVRQAIDGESRQRREDAERQQIIERFETLTDRELSVLDGILVGRSNKEIAGGIDLSHKTVEYHRRKLMEKLGVTCIAQLVRAVMIAVPERVSYLDNGGEVDAD